jgi:hypothetical protein
MRCRTDVLLFATIVLLLGACPGWAQAVETGVYVDGLSTGLGAAFGAIRVRAGAGFPLADRWSLAPEAELYFSLPEDTVFNQVALTAIVRFLPWETVGFYLGAGPGVGWFDSRATASAGGVAAYNHWGLKAFLIAETGWTIRFGSFPLYLEPFIRGFISGGWEALTGSALTASSTDFVPWTVAFGVDFGLRIGWRL